MGNTPISPKRRRLLRYLASAGLTGIAGCAESEETVSSTTTSNYTEARTEFETTEQTNSEQQWEIDPLEHDLLIGAHYYVWYNSDSWWMDWLDRVPGEPELGEYTSSNREVINQHIKWALEHGINWFNISWWGPKSDEGRILEENFLNADLASHIDFSILYESTGRLQSARDDMSYFHFENGENEKQLIRDFKYLEETFFGENNYLRINNRPVIFIYLASSMSGQIKEAFANAKDAIEAEPYLIGDVLSAGPAILHNDWIDEFDAVSLYNLYNPQIVADRDFSEFVEYVDKSSLNWKLTANHVNLNLIPNVIPGYNDSIYRDNPVLNRSSEGFQRLLDMALERRSDGINAILITSFNEWPEYTAIEPGQAFGTTYLEIIEEKLTKVSNDKSESVDPDSYDVLQIDFNQTIQPEGSDRDLALVGKNITLVGSDGSVIKEYDIGVTAEEPYLIEGAYSPEQNPSWGTTRWFGGPTARATIYFGPDLATPTLTEWTGLPMRDDEIEADIYFNEQHTDHVTFGKREMTTYQFSLST